MLISISLLIISYFCKKDIVGRILAFDYGRKRVGIAVTDPMQIIANGLTTLHPEKVFAFLDEYLQTENIERFVVGYPRQMNNTASEAVRYVNPFIKRLVKKYPHIPVELMDERFTSKMAQQTMLDAGLKKKARQNKSLVDTISATIILQSYMQQMKF